MRCHLLMAASERSDHVAGMDEIERLRLELAVEEVVDGQLHVRDPLGLQKRAGGSEQTFIDVAANHLARGADPLAEDPKPAQSSAACVQDSLAGSVADLREKVPPTGFPHARLELQALQLRGLVGEQVLLV